jgi:hypothetical protein
MKKEVNVMEALTALSKGKKVKFDLENGHGEVIKRKLNYEVRIFKDGVEQPSLFKGPISLAMKTLQGTANKPYVEQEGA